jgi:hypothetical protein
VPGLGGAKVLSAGNGPMRLEGILACRASTHAGIAKSPISLAHRARVGSHTGSVMPIDPAASILRHAAAPSEVFPPWRRAQVEVDRLARDRPPAPCALRTTGFLRPDVAERVSDWFTGSPTAPADSVRRSYRALERETARLFDVVRGGLGVRVRYVRDENDPYRGAAELCAELREHGSMSLATIAREQPHPLLGGEEGGAVDQLRVVHDVLGHAALGLGFDVQSEFATWLQCRTLFSDDARGAAFCELVGAVTAYVTTGEKPGLRADLPPVELVAALDKQPRKWKLTVSADLPSRRVDRARRSHAAGDLRVPRRASASGR